MKRPFASGLKKQGIAFSSDEATLRAYGTATFPLPNEVVGVVRPKSTEQVRAVVRLASRCRVALYPISRGNNWGYGSKVPASGGCVVMDLSGMRRILGFDETLAYIRVEPGVTFRDVHEFLERRRSKLMINPIGSAPDCSVLGNALERGIGFGIYGNRFEHVSSLEVVLADGTRVLTGHRRFEDDATADVFRPGLGPQIDGLFFQSNFGVVTAMTVYLAQKPAHLRLYRFTIERGTGLPAAVDALTRLRLGGVINQNFGIANAYKVLVNLGGYPRAAAKGVTPLPRKLLSKLKTELGIGDWNGSGALVGFSAGHLRELEGRLSEELGSRVSRLELLKPGDSNAGRAAAYSRVGDVYLGKPTDLFVRQAYWRMGSEAPGTPAPERDGVGALFYSPVVAARGATVRAAVLPIERIILSHGFEPVININSVADRYAYLIVSIYFDRGIPGEDLRAMACYDELYREGLKKGLVPYRAGNQTLRKLPQCRDDFPLLFRKLEKAMNPLGTLSPGRYDTWS